MRHQQSLIIAFPEPHIREDRINLIARRFSLILLSEYEEKLSNLDIQIKCARNKGDLKEVLRLTEKSMMDKRVFLKKYGVKRTFEWEQYGFEDYYGYDFLDKTEEQRKAIRVIYENFWALVEEAIPSINRKEQIRIDISEKNSDTWLSDVRYAHEKPYSGYTCGILLKLIQIDQYGRPVLDDLGFERSIDPWYAAAVIDSSIFRLKINFDSIYERLLSDKSFGYYNQYQNTKYKEEDEQEISLVKSSLGNLANSFPWIQQLIPDNGCEASCNNKLIADDLHLVAFFSGFRQTSLMSRWFQYVLAGENPYRDYEVIYNNEGCINLDYLNESIFPKIKQLKTKISSIPFNKDRDYQLCRCLLDNATSDTSYIVLFTDILKALGIPDLYPTKCWEMFILSRLKCGEHVIIDEVIDVVYKTLTDIAKRNEFDYSYSGSTVSLTNDDLIKEFEELYIKLDEATTTIKINPQVYYQDASDFLKYNCASNLCWSKGAEERGYDMSGGEHYCFEALIQYLDNEEYDHVIAEGLIHKDIEIAIESGNKPKLEDLVVETIIDEKENFNYKLLLKKNSKRYLFFDTETTGLPKNYQAPSSDTNNWPRLVQLSWIITDEHGAKIKDVNRIIKPSGFNIPKSSEQLHGISTDRALLVGKNLNEVLDEFTYDLNSAIIVIGHNVEFDKKIIGAEFIRAGRKDIITPKIAICTMKTSYMYCKIPGGNSSYRYPKLVELHKKLFGVGFNDAHNASSDVAATEKCFWELIRLGIIKVEDFLNLPF